MVFRTVKYAVIGAGGLLLVGGLLFGSDLFSYGRSSVKTVQAAVKDAVPIEFELKRARDLLDGIIPELHANVRLIAQEEVEVNNLKQDITQHRLAMGDEKTRIQKLRDSLAVQQVSYTFGGRQFSREQLTDDLSRRFEQFKEAQVILAGKERLLDAREKALQSAMVMLDRTKGQKARLEDKIGGLESQWRLVKAAAAGSRIQVDSSKLAQTEKVIAEIKKRLDVSERILAHEAQFVTEVPVDAVNEKDLVQQVDDYFSPKPVTNQQARAEQTDDAVALGDVQVEQAAQ